MCSIATTHDAAIKKNPDDPRPSYRPALDRRSYRHAEQLAKMRDTLDTHRHAPRPLGQQGQQPHRQDEGLIRRRAIAFSRWAHKHGIPLCEAAQRLHMSAWTLGNWARAWDVDRLLGHTLGRPRQQASPIQCVEVTECLQQAGPTIGLPALHSQFPDVARSQLADLQRQYRDNCLNQKDIFAEALEWLVPGSVWAVDFSESPLPIDINCHYILAVRDLASHYQLLALPVPFANAVAAVAALRHLFTIHAPPLVLKSDNGSPFIAQDFQYLLLQWKVTQLLSPPRWPMYNGSIEAGFGALKTRIFFEASRHGRHDHWLADDVEAARLLANTASRPWGRLAQTPQQRWDERSRLTDQQRTDFLQALADCTQRVKAELGLALIPDLVPKDRATVARQATGRALQQLGHLQVQRRRITPPFKLAKVGRIS
jgi:transposase InsO family protein